MRRLHPHKIDDARWYERIWGVEHNSRPYYDAVRQRALVARVKDGDSVCDLGAGVYGAAQYIAEHTDLRVRLVAVDQSYTARDVVMAALAGQSHAYLSFDYVLSMIPRVPRPDASFDVVAAGELIEHYEDPAELVREMARLCKPGGWMVISTVDTNCANARKLDYPEHLWEFAPDDLTGLFLPYGMPRYGLVGDYHFLECHRA